MLAGALGWSGGMSAADDGWDPLGGGAQPLTPEERLALQDFPLALRALESCNGAVFVPQGPEREWTHARPVVVMGFEEPDEQVQQWAVWLRRRLCVIGRLPKEYAWVCLDDEGGCFVVGFADLDLCLRGPGGWERTVMALVHGHWLRPVLAPGEDSIWYYERLVRRGDPDVFEP